MVSLTAAKTSLMLEVSVACVRLRLQISRSSRISRVAHLLRIKVEMSSVDLIESP